MHSLLFSTDIDLPRSLGDIVSDDSGKGGQKECKPGHTRHGRVLLVSRLEVSLINAVDIATNDDSPLTAS